MYTILLVDDRLDVRIQHDSPPDLGGFLDVREAATGCDAVPSPSGKGQEPVRREKDVHWVLPIICDKNGRRLERRQEHQHAFHLFASGSVHTTPPAAGIRDGVHLRVALPITLPRLGGCTPETRVRL